MSSNVRPLQSKPPAEGPWTLSSNEVRFNLADAMFFVRNGGTVIITHYNRPIVEMRPYKEDE